MDEDLADQVAGIAARVVASGAISWGTMRA
jgi:hypothetical protein